MPNGGVMTAECREHFGRPSAPNAIDRDSYDRCMRERGYASRCASLD
jgi:hypothetical protein